MFVLRFMSHRGVHQMFLVPLCRFRVFFFFLLKYRLFLLYVQHIFYLNQVFRFITTVRPLTNTYILKRLRRT